MISIISGKNSTNHWGFDLSTEPAIWLNFQPNEQESAGNAQNM